MFNWLRGKNGAPKTKDMVMLDGRIGPIYVYPENVVNIIADEYVYEGIKCHSLVYLRDRKYPIWCVDEPHIIKMLLDGKIERVAPTVV